MSNKTRVRFAPAPTGFLHIGSARSALFNWLYARHTGGVLVLRIEDTNEALKRDEFIDAITGPLQWLGLDWDEGPFFQSERTQLYSEAVEQLVESGQAYYCDLSREQVNELCEAQGLPAGYHGFSRDKGLPDGEGTVIRFRAPDEGTTVIDDVIRGRVEFENAHIEDFVIRRSDGSSGFLVANAVDDHDMGITHVVRGEDMLSTTPKVVMLWQALGFGDTPTYAHLPLLVNEQRKKLSKRKDDVSLGEFRRRGYMPEAMLNHLALLGWGPPDEVEVRPVAEIIELFDLENVTKGAAFFDVKKLDSINAEYVRAQDLDTFISDAEPYLTAADTPWPAKNYSAEVFARLASEVQQRVATHADTTDFVDWVFNDEISYDEKSWAKGIVKAKLVPEILAGVIERFATCDWEAETLADTVRAVGDDLGARSQVPVRVAVTGRNFGIPLWDGLVALGREQTIVRLQATLGRL
ncbi:MAG: glutamate--tRNA ligase [Acidimicrobiales bacterium]